MDFYSAALLLFLVMDPLGNIPIYLSTLTNVKPERRLKVVARELLVALLVMIIFLYSGQFLLDVLHLSEEAIRISGGIILFLLALKMVFPVPRAMKADEDIDGEPFLVPLAIPLVAGPSSIAILMLLAGGEPEKITLWLLALLAAWFITAIILLAATRLQHMLGKRGLIAMERLMGLLLIAISIQMFLDGLTNYLKNQV